MDVQKALLGRFAEKLSQLIPSSPSRLIKEEIALELAAMTKRLLDAPLMFQRALYRSHILHKTFQIFPTSDSAPLQRSCGGFRSECARGRAKMLMKSNESVAIFSNAAAHTPPLRPLH